MELGPDKKCQVFHDPAAPYIESVMASSTGREINIGNASSALVYIVTLGEKKGE